MSKIKNTIIAGAIGAAALSPTAAFADSSSLTSEKIVQCMTSQMILNGTIDKYAPEGGRLSTRIDFDPKGQIHSIAIDGQKVIYSHDSNGNLKESVRGNLLETTVQKTDNGTIEVTMMEYSGKIGKSGQSNASIIEFSTSGEVLYHFDGLRHSSSGTVATSEVSQAAKSCLTR